MESSRLPPELETVLIADREGRAVEAAPHAEPRTPAEWLRQNLFSSPVNSAVTVLVGLLAGWAGWALLRWVVVTADWRVVQANMRVFMVARFPEGKLWSIWASLYVVVALAGLAWGVRGLRLSWTPRKAVLRAALATIGVLALVYLLEGLSIWLWIGLAAAIYATGVALGRAFPRALRVPLIVGWILAFPIVIWIVRFLADVQPARWGGFFLNMVLAVVAIFASFPFGVFLALGRRSTLWVISKFSVLFIEFIRGVPLFTLLLFGQFVLPLLLPEGIDLAPIVRAMMMYTIFSAAYVAEIVRGGLQGIPDGQYEAGRAVGLSTTRLTALVILPQALRNTIPAMISNFISLFKDTSLIAGLSMLDLLAVARRAPRLEFSGDIRESLLMAMLIFWIVAFAMSRWSQRLERRLGVGER